MLKFLIILLIVIYIWSILDKSIKFIKITSCIDTLNAFLQSASPSHVDGDYRRQLNAVLAKYPDICEFTSFSSDTLRYGESDHNNYVASANLYNELLMQRNFLRKKLIRCLNPINAVKIQITLPSSIFKLFGFKLNSFFTKFLNLAGWIITYFLGMYQDEIKTFITSLLKLH